MSSVDSLRARFAKEEHERRLANQAALTGAVLAFPKSSASSSVSAPATTRAPRSGASAAATKIWQNNMTVDRPTPPIKTSSLSAASTGAVKAHQKSQETLLFNQSRTTSSRATSPSHTAANVAAANYKLQHPPVLKAKNARSLQPPQQRSGTGKQEEPENQDTDRLPEPGTVKDVKRWLQALDSSATDGQSPDVQSIRSISGSASTVQAGKPSIKSSSGRTLTPIESEKPEVTSTPVILSPRPVRAVSAAGSIDAMTPREALNAPPVPKKAARLRSTSSSTGRAADKQNALPSSKASTQAIKPVGLVHDDDKPPAPTRTTSKPSAPPPRRSRPSTVTEPGPSNNSAMLSGPAMSSAVGSRSPVELQFQSHRALPGPNPPPLIPKYRQASPATFERPILPPRTQTDSTVREPTPPPAIPPRPSVDSSISLFPPRQSVSPAPSSYAAAHRSSLDLPTRSLPMRRVSPSISTSSLANAIVASSLASSRTASPTKAPSSPAPSLPPRPSKFSLPFSRASTFIETRTPSPGKLSASNTGGGMRRTMRESSSSDEDVTVFKTRKGPKKYWHKHPHKHHEGTRKRWQNYLNDVERKRYEGVWAANRGLLLPLEPEFKECVHGYVVRDIWSRSRLPAHVLEEVWELILSGDGDAEREGCYLKKVEFVVGMWLIDQKLRGWKLPVKVGHSVWESARGISGIRVPVYK